MYKRYIKKWIKSKLVNRSKFFHRSKYVNINTKFWRVFKKWDIKIQVDKSTTNRIDIPDRGHPNKKYNKAFAHKTKLINIRTYLKDTKKFNLSKKRIKKAFTKSKIAGFNNLAHLDSTYNIDTRFWFSNRIIKTN